MQILKTSLLSCSLLSAMIEASPLQSQSDVLHSSSILDPPTVVRKREQEKPTDLIDVNDFISGLPEEKSRDCKGSFVCQMISDSCDLAAARYVDDLVYTSYTSYVYKRTGFKHPDSCTAIFSSLLFHPRRRIW
jgi:hypothetical protein